MKKINQYGNFFILCSCEAKNEKFAKLDGTEFRYLSDAVEFMLNNKEEISKQKNNICIMVWRETFNADGNHSYNECVDEIYLNDIYDEEK